MIYSVIELMGTWFSSLLRRGARWRWGEGTGGLSSRDEAQGWWVELLWGQEYILTLLSSLQDAMPKTLGPKVLALDKELEPWSTQSEAAVTCAPCLFLSFSSAVPEASDTSPSLSPAAHH